MRKTFSSAAVVFGFLAAATGESHAMVRAPMESVVEHGAGHAVGSCDEYRLSELFAVPANNEEIPVRLAHAILVKAAPDREAVVTDVPEEILLIFNDGVGEQFLALAVTDEAGKRVDNHDAKLDFMDRSHLRATVSRLTPGRYQVRYRVLSADGHVVSGKYFFQVQHNK